MSPAYQQPDPHDSTDEWEPPDDTDVVGETHRFETIAGGETMIVVYDATCEFGGDAWVETGAFVSLKMTR